jgi:hypothetical protein
MEMHGKTICRSSSPSSRHRHIISGTRPGDLDVILIRFAAHVKAANMFLSGWGLFAVQSSVMNFV